MRRVVVTGLGALTPIGDNVKDYWAGLLAGANGVSRVEKFDPSEYYSQVAAQVKNLDPTKRLDPKEVRKQDDYTVYALYAAAETMEDSGLLGAEIDRTRVGVIIASGIGGIGTLEREEAVLLEKGPTRVSPYLVPTMIPDMAAGLVSMKYGFMGPNFCVVSACASSSHAIGVAMRAIQYGEADAIVAGGSEAPITPLSLAGFSSMRALSSRNNEPEKASRPFDAERDGFVIGEGAGIVVLEELEHAKRRGARIYAELAGYAATADAHHITAPHPEGLGAFLVMKRALEDAGVNLDEVDYVNAHGTSTPLNDKAETEAIKKLFGDRAYKLAISSTKSMIGHLLGASGVAEFIATSLSVKEQVVHPTRNYEHPDPDCDLDYVPEGARKMGIRVAISNSFGFGGHNACLVVKRFED
jgi:3-oxoacyl-[acyl-carrier-protein] synthase II